MMMNWWYFQWLWSYLIFGTAMEANWMPSNSTNVQLLGLFSDISKTSLDDTISIHSHAMFKAAIVLSQKYNITIEGKHIGWQSISTGGNVMDALTKTCQLISNSNILGIVGPEFSRESHFLIPFATKINIPIISYAATDPELSDRNAYPTFYRTVPSDNSAALAIVQLFLYFNWTTSIIIYQNDAFGKNGAHTISEAFHKYDLTISDTILFDISTKTIQGDLKSLLTSTSIRIILVWATPIHTQLILQNALENDILGPRFTWILSSNIPFNNFHRNFYDKLIGILVIEPVVGNFVNQPINKTLLDAAYEIWRDIEPETFPQIDTVDNYALFAFDATWTLIQSLSKFCSKLFNTSSPCVLSSNTSSCFDRQFQHSNLLFDIINNQSFLGVSGSIQFSPNITDRINGSYYVAKNIQPSATSGLTSNSMLVWLENDGWINHRQTNDILWPGKTRIIPSGYATLSDVTLKIVVEVEPFTMEVEKTDGSGRKTRELIGYIPDLIKALEEKMGFKSNIIKALSNQTYNGLIDDIEHGIYDIFVADTTITAERMKKVTFSSSIFDNSLRIIIRKGTKPDIDLLSYLRPFTTKLWIILLIASIYSSFLVFILERKQNEFLQDKSISNLIVTSIWYSFGTILGFGVDIHVRTAAGRLLTIGLYILSLVLIAGYTADLAADLTLTKTQSIISGIDDIKNGKIPFNRIGIYVNTSIEAYYLREISNSNRNFYPLKNEQDMYEKLLNHLIDASIMDAAVIDYSTGNIYCNLTLVGNDFDKNAFGIVFKKKWLYQQDLDFHILSLREDGTLDELKRRWFQTSVCSRSSNELASMTIESMAGLFLTFLVISILAILLFIWTQRSLIKNYLCNLKHLRVFSEP